MKPSNDSQRQGSKNWKTPNSSAGRQRPFIAGEQRCYGVVEQQNIIEEALATAKKVKEAAELEAKGILAKAVQDAEAIKRKGLLEAADEIAKMKEAAQNKINDELSSRIDALQKREEEQAASLKVADDNMAMHRILDERVKNPFNEELIESIAVARSAKKVREAENKTLTSEAEREADREHIKQLRADLAAKESLFQAYESLRTRVGDDPAGYLKKVNGMLAEIGEREKRLISEPSAAEEKRLAERDKTISDLRKQLNNLEAKMSGCLEQAREVESLRLELSHNERKLALAEGKSEEFSAEVAYYTDKCKKMEMLLAPSVIAEERYHNIEHGDVQVTVSQNIPRISYAENRHGKEIPCDVPDEISWLNSILECCSSYGVVFPRRVLHAFHTSLKTADYSMLTILAGVSGTGKSLLPKLYSVFGGLVFESVSVKPNWDSPEAFLGYFNSIDNKFSCQPVLRLLANAQTQWPCGSSEKREAPKFKNNVCAVLLDEMNLAHPELYFADFLSILENRRMEGKGAEPVLLIDMGAGSNPYPLRLTRNVFWIGTMNEDGTTHSLADKVVDRASIIYFPRPKTLERRKNRKSLSSFIGELGDKAPKPLHFDYWRMWRQSDMSIPDGDFGPYEECINKINGYLGKVGRSLGHRVMQAIEAYMALYPDVISSRAKVKALKKELTAETTDANRQDIVSQVGDAEIKYQQALHVAFEDQLVQKVMPKLRGINSHREDDSYKQCLKPIREVLQGKIAGMNFGNLISDFDSACNLGHGQFSWQTAEYVYQPIPLPEVSEQAEIPLSAQSEPEGSGS